MMSFKQRAKKKLVGSFSKRKKLKLSDSNSENVGYTDLPPPLPLSRPPIPDFSAVLAQNASAGGSNLSPVSSSADVSSIAGSGYVSSCSSSASFDDDFPTACSASVDFRLQATNEMRATSVFQNYQEPVDQTMTSPESFNQNLATGFSFGQIQNVNVDENDTSRPNAVSTTSKEDSQQDRNRTDYQQKPRSMYSRMPLVLQDLRNRLFPASETPSSPSASQSSSSSSSSSSSFDFKCKSGQGGCSDFNPRKSPTLSRVARDEAAYINSLFASIISNDTGSASGTNIKATDSNTMDEDTDEEGTVVLEEERILTHDVGIFEEVFDECQQKSPSFCIDSEQSDDSTLDFTLSSDEGEEDEDEDDDEDNGGGDDDDQKKNRARKSGRVRSQTNLPQAKDSAQSHTLRGSAISLVESKEHNEQIASSYPDDVFQSSAPLAKKSASSKTSKKSKGSVMNKVQFFESQKSPLEAKTQKTQSINSQQFPQTSGKPPPVPRNSKSRQKSVPNYQLPSNQKSAHYHGPGLPSTRMNFSRFRRSGSIPETEILCSCGRGCEGACSGHALWRWESHRHALNSNSSTGDDEDIDNNNCVGWGLDSAGKRSRNSQGDTHSSQGDTHNSQGGSHKMQSTSSRVCHHPQCTEHNSDMPLQLCRPCDQSIHRQSEFQGHLVLDCNRKLPIIVRPHSPSPYDDGSDSDQGSYSNPTGIPEEPLDDGYKLFVKNSSKSRSKSPTELGRKLKRKKAVKKKHSNTGNDVLEAALAQIANPEGSMMDTDATHSTKTDSDAPSDSSAGVNQGVRDSNWLDNFPSGQSRGDSLDSTDGGQHLSVLPNRGPVRRQSRVLTYDTHFTLKFASRQGQRDELEVVAAVSNTTLRDAIESVLHRRHIDIDNVHVFIEKSGTPLPLSSDSSFLAGNTLEIKEKDERDGETAGSSSSSNHHKQRANSTSKSGSGKSNKQSGRNSRRESVGVVQNLLEPPPTKQRRGSLQLPFREHFFNKGDPKPDPMKGTVDDNFGSLRGRGRGVNLSIDDTCSVPSTSPQGTLTEGKKNKGQKLSVVNLFGPTNKDRERQEQLNEILNRYGYSGLPRVPDLLSFGRLDFDEAIFDMEKHWKEMVDNHEQMSRKQQEHQEAVWELLNTEVSYLKQIRVIIDVFQNCLINIQQEGLLNEIETERLFSNIDKIFECNATFWQDYLYPVVVQGRKNRQPLDIISCKEAFTVHFQNMFQVYFKYFIEHKSSIDYAKSCMDNGELFKTFILWAEAQKQCNRLKMADILVKPMQRLLKYSLLLQAVLKLTESEKDKKELREMISAVEKLCWAANNSLQRREDFEKLEAVRKTIDNYDAIEAPNDECAKIIQEYNGNFNLLAPMKGFRDGQPRNLLLHSNMRMKEAQAAKMDVDCLLFTDLILICKSNRKMDRFKVIRPPMSLDQLVVAELKDKGSFLLIYTNEYHVPISAFTFHSDINVIRSWMERFKEAQKDYKRRKMEESAEMEKMRLTAISVQEEVECTPLDPAHTNLDLNLPRSDSIEYTDRFMPNLLTPGTPQHYAQDGSHGEIGRCSSTGDIQNRLASHLPDGHYGGERHPVKNGSATKNTSMSVSTENPSAFRDKRSHTVMDSPSRGNPLQPCNSVPAFPTSNVPVDRRSRDNCYVAVEINNRNVSFMDPDAAGHQDWLTSQTSVASDANSVFEDDVSKIRHNTRRVSRSEKRYHTADAIQDMKNQEKDKDNSIHKRLSLRADDEQKNLGSKILSSESVLSIRSSSGVSSTGSLHTNLDISEEGEGVNSNITNNNNVKDRNTSISQQSSISNNHNNNNNYPTSQQHIPVINLVASGFQREDDGENDDDNVNGDTSELVPDGRQSKSRSTSDLTNMFSQMQVSQLEDGIASVAMVNETFHRKLTHADILKMKMLKQQILYDANIESSEV